MVEVDLGKEHSSCPDRPGRTVPRPTFFAGTTGPRAASSVGERLAIGAAPHFAMADDIAQGGIVNSPSGPSTARHIPTTQGCAQRSVKPPKAYGWTRFPWIAVLAYVYGSVFHTRLIDATATPPTLPCS
jgi:hypothetical protein